MENLCPRKCENFAEIFTTFSERKSTTSMERAFWTKKWRFLKKIDQPKFWLVFLSENAIE